MSEFEIVTRRDRIKGVPERWKAQYFFNGEWRLGLRIKEIYEKLVKLDLNFSTEKDISDVIGNGSWTRLSCDNCEKETVKAVFLKGRSSNEYGDDLYCRSCVEGALKSLKEEG